MSPNSKTQSKPNCYKDDCFNIVFAGNIGEAQGLDLLIGAAAELKEHSNISFYIVGDGRAKQRLSEFAENNGLPNVHFVGKVSEQEADRYIHFADCAYLSFER